jgi:uncharacterized protein (DUF1330 family)
VSAYVIAEIEITEAGLAAEYRQIAAAALTQHGGRYVVRSTVPEALEGQWPPGRRIVVLEFDDLDAARRWYHSPEYAPGIEIAGRAMTRRVAIVPGPDQ